MSGSQSTGPGAPWEGPLTQLSWDVRLITSQMQAACFKQPAPKGPRILGNGGLFSPCLPRTHTPLQETLQQSWHPLHWPWGSAFEFSQQAGAQGVPCSRITLLLVWFSGWVAALSHSLWCTDWALLPAAFLPGPEAPAPPGTAQGRPQRPGSVWRNQTHIPAGLCVPPPQSEKRT